MVSLIINGKPVCVPEGTSILEAARAANIDIPTLCYLKDLNEIGACRICMVEVEGQDTLVAACDNEVHEGMVVHTNSQKVRMTRRVNLQLLLSQHEVNCVKCTRSGNCKLQKLANDYNLLGAPYQKKLRPAPVDYSAPILRFENRFRCVEWQVKRRVWRGSSKQFPQRRFRDGKDTRFPGFTVAAVQNGFCLFRQRGQHDLKDTIRTGRFYRCVNAT